MSEYVRELKFILKYVFRKIKINLKLRKATKKQYDLIRDLAVGDIVWCEMDLPLKELLKIEYSHRFHPYLIIRKRKRETLAYPLTSNLKRQNQPEKYYQFKKSEISSFVSFTQLCEIKPYQLQKKHSKISDYDAIMLNQAIHIHVGPNSPIITKMLL